MKKKKNLKQMVKSNKKAEVGVEREASARFHRHAHRHSEVKEKSEHTGSLFLFYSCFSKSCKANRERGRKYKGLCSHFQS